MNITNHRKSYQNTTSPVFKKIIQYCLDFILVQFVCKMVQETCYSVYNTLG